MFKAKMSACCVSGCRNRHSSTSKLKFYRIPSGYRPFQANRRRLWLQAIQQVNGSTEEVRGNARICGAHFISGTINSPLSFYYTKLHIRDSLLFVQLTLKLCKKNLDCLSVYVLQGRRPWTTTVRTLCLLYSHVVNQKRAPRKK